MNAEKKQRLDELSICRIISKYVGDLCIEAFALYKGLED